MSRSRTARWDLSLRGEAEYLKRTCFHGSRRWLRFEWRKQLFDGIARAGGGKTSAGTLNSVCSSGGRVGRREKIASISPGRSGTPVASGDAFITSGWGCPSLSLMLTSYLSESLTEAGDTFVSLTRGMEFVLPGATIPGWGRFVNRTIPPEKSKSELRRVRGHVLCERQVFVACPLRGPPPTVMTFRLELCSRFVNIDRTHDSWPGLSHKAFSK